VSATAIEMLMRMRPPRYLRLDELRQRGQMPGPYGVIRQRAAGDRKGGGITMKLPWVSRWTHEAAMQTMQDRLQREKDGSAQRLLYDTERLIKAESRANAAESELHRAREERELLFYGPATVGCQHQGEWKFYHTDGSGQWSEVPSSPFPGSSLPKD
jgi:hypothetical protein